MPPRLKAFKSALKTLSRPSRVTSRRSFIRIPVETPIDEETLPYYAAEQFYPVHIGDVYDSRYRVAGKLGFGAYSTSWLCWDLRYDAIDVKMSLPLT